MRENQRQDVALAGEEPAEGRTADEGGGDQDGIGPVQGGENGSREDRRGEAIFHRGEKTVHDQRLQGDFLQRAEGEIAEEAARVENVRGKMLEGLQSEAKDAERGGEGGEHFGGAARGGPKIISAPAKSSGRVAMQSKTGDEPDGKDEPAPKIRVLQPPNIEGGKAGEGQRLEEIRDAESARRSALFCECAGRSGELAGERGEAGESEIGGSAAEERVEIEVGEAEAGHGFREAELELFAGKTAETALGDFLKEGAMDGILKMTFLERE